MFISDASANPTGDQMHAEDFYNDQMFDDPSVITSLNESAGWL